MTTKKSNVKITPAYLINLKKKTKHPNTLNKEVLTIRVINFSDRRWIGCYLKYFFLEDENEFVNTIGKALFRSNKNYKIRENMAI